MSRPILTLDRSEDEQSVQTVQSLFSQQLCAASAESREDRQTQVGPPLPTLVTHQEDKPPPKPSPVPSAAGTGSLQQHCRSRSSQPEGEGKESGEQGCVHSQTVPLLPGGLSRPGLSPTDVHARGSAPSVCVSGPAADLDSPQLPQLPQCSILPSAPAASQTPVLWTQATSSGSAVQTTLPSASHRGQQGQRKGFPVDSLGAASSHFRQKESWPLVMGAESDFTVGGKSASCVGDGYQGSRGGQVSSHLTNSHRDESRLSSNHPSPSILSRQELGGRSTASIPSTSAATKSSHTRVNAAPGRTPSSHPRKRESSNSSYSADHKKPRTEGGRGDSRHQTTAAFAKSTGSTKREKPVRAGKREQAGFSFQAESSVTGHSTNCGTTREKGTPLGSPVSAEMDTAGHQESQRSSTAPQILPTLASLARETDFSFVARESSTRETNKCGTSCGLTVASANGRGGRQDRQRGERGQQKRGRTERCGREGGQRGREKEGCVRYEGREGGRGDAVNAVVFTGFPTNGSDSLSLYPSLDSYHLTSQPPVDNAQRIGDDNGNMDIHDTDDKVGIKREIIDNSQHVSKTGAAEMSVNPAKDVKEEEEEGQYCEHRKHSKDVEQKNEENSQYCEHREHSKDTEQTEQEDGQHCEHREHSKGVEQKEEVDGQYCEHKELNKDDTALIMSGTSVQWKILFETSLPITSHYSDIPEVHNIEDVKENAEIWEAHIIEDIKEYADKREIHNIEDVKENADISEVHNIEEVKENADIPEVHNIEDVKENADKREVHNIEDVKENADIPEVHNIEDVKGNADQREIHNIEDVKGNADKLQHLSPEQLQEECSSFQTIDKFRDDCKADVGHGRNESGSVNGSAHKRGAAADLSTVTTPLQNTVNDNIALTGVHGIGRRKQRSPRQVQRSWSRQYQLITDVHNMQSLTSELEYQGQGNTRPDLKSTCSTWAPGSLETVQQTPQQYIHTLTRYFPHKQTASQRPQTFRVGRSTETGQNPDVSVIASAATKTGTFHENCVENDPNPCRSDTVSEPNTDTVSEPETTMGCSSQLSRSIHSSGNHSEHVPAATDTSSQDKNSASKIGKRLETSAAGDSSSDVRKDQQAPEIKLNHVMRGTRMTSAGSNNSGSVNMMTVDTDLSLRPQSKSVKSPAWEVLLNTNNISKGKRVRKIVSIDDHPLLQNIQRLVASVDPDFDPLNNRGESELRPVPYTSSKASFETSTAQVSRPYLSQRNPARSRWNSHIEKRAKGVVSKQDVRFSHLLQSFSKKAEGESLVTQTVANSTYVSELNLSTKPLLTTTVESTRELTKYQPDDCLLDVIHSPAVTDTETQDHGAEDTRLSPQILSKSIKDMMSLKDGLVQKGPSEQQRLQNQQCRAQTDSIPNLKPLHVHLPLSQKHQPKQEIVVHDHCTAKHRNNLNSKQGLPSNEQGTVSTEGYRFTEKQKDQSKRLPKPAQLLTNSNLPPVPATAVSMLRIPCIPLPIYSPVFPAVIPALPQLQTQSSPPLPIVTSSESLGVQDHVAQPQYMPIVPKVSVLPAVHPSLIIEHGSCSATAPSVSFTPSGCAAGENRGSGQQMFKSGCTTIPHTIPRLSLSQSQTGQGVNGTTQMTVAHIGMVSNQVFPGSRDSIPVLLLPSFSSCITPSPPGEEQRITPSLEKKMEPATVREQQSPKKRKDTDDQVSSEENVVHQNSPQPAESKDSKEKPTNITDTLQTALTSHSNSSIDLKEEDGAAAWTASNQDNTQKTSMKGSPKLGNVKVESPVILKSGRKRTASTRYDSHVELDFSDATDYGEITSDDEWTPEKDNDGEASLSSDDEEINSRSHKKDAFENLFHPAKKQSGSRATQTKRHMWMGGNKKMAGAPSGKKGSDSFSLRTNFARKADNCTAKSIQSSFINEKCDWFVGGKGEVSAVMEQTEAEGDPRSEKKRVKQHADCCPTKSTTSRTRGSRIRRKTPYTEEELTCRICKKMFTNIYRLRRHEFSHGNERPFVCDVCGKAFKQSGHRNEHRLTHNANKRSFLCNICGVIISSRSSFRYHLLSHKHLLDGMINTASYQIVTSPGTEAATTSQSGHHQTGTLDDGLSTSMGAQFYGKLTQDSSLAAYDCPHCTDRFATAQSLNCHLESHPEVDSRCHVQPFVCTECGRSFTYRHNLEKHHADHVKPEKRSASYQRKVQAAIADGKPHFTCHLCGKVYLRKETLSKHSKTHLGLKPYQCDVCDKSFTQKIHLTVHSRLHTGSRPFQCRTCHCCFLDSTALARHVQRDVCKSEGLSFSVGKRGRKPFHAVLEDRLKAVVKDKKACSERKGPKSLQCGLCKWKGRRHGFLARHIKRCHPHTLHTELLNINV